MCILGREVANCVRTKTTVRTHVTTFPEGLPHSTLTAPNLLVRNCSRFVGHKLSTVLCRCCTGPHKANELVHKTYKDVFTMSFLSAQNSYPRCHMQCVVTGQTQSLLGSHWVGLGYDYRHESDTILFFNLFQCQKDMGLQDTEFQRSLLYWLPFLFYLSFP